MEAYCLAVSTTSPWLPKVFAHFITDSNLVDFDRRLDYYRTITEDFDWMAYLCMISQVSSDSS